MKTEKRYTLLPRPGYTLVKNAEGPVLGMTSLRLKEADGLAFKNLSGQDSLLPYEDWRLPKEVRARDLAGRLSKEHIAGLMLWSPHQMVPFLPGMPFKGHYDGENYVPGKMDPAALTDQQKSLVREQNIRMSYPQLQVHMEK